MPGKQPYVSRPGDNERSIVEEMIRNQDSEHWKACDAYVASRVYGKTKGLLRSDQQEIIQESMYKTAKSLRFFRFDCSFKSWLGQIIDNCIIDKHRQSRYGPHLYLPLMSSPDEKDYESEEPLAIEEKSAEEVFEIKENVRGGLSALIEYARTHANPVRNELIIRMVVFEGHTQVETARIVGCDVGVVGYVVREAQRYAREKMK